MSRDVNQDSLILFMLHMGGRTDTKAAREEGFLRSLRATLATCKLKKAGGRSNIQTGIT